MSILFSGDFHANSRSEIISVTKKSLIKKYGREKYNGIKYHIILGDGGFMLRGNEKNDLASYKVLTRRPFPVLCVIGNHEPILGMNDVPEVDIGIGEKVLLVNKADPFVAYLKRGKVYDIDGFKFLVLGGALSIDRKTREPDGTWWPGEYWSEREERDVFKLLETQNTFDGVLSHTGPERVNRKLAWPFSPFPFILDNVARFNERVDDKVRCPDWWCGHWHRDLYLYNPEIKRGYQYLYRTTKILEKTGNGTEVYNEYKKTWR
jgi:hypothetical protein